MSCSCNPWGVSAVEPVYYTNNTGMLMTIYWISGVCRSIVDDVDFVCSKVVVPSNSTVDYAFPSGGSGIIHQVDERGVVATRAVIPGERLTSDNVYRYWL